MNPIKKILIRKWLDKFLHDVASAIIEEIFEEEGFGMSEPLGRHLGLVPFNEASSLVRPKLPDLKSKWTYNKIPPYLWNNIYVYPGTCKNIMSSLSTNSMFQDNIIKEEVYTFLDNSSI